MTMQIGVQTGGPDKYHDIDGVYRLLKETGFDAADVNIDQLPLTLYSRPFSDVLDAYRPYGEAAKKYGIDNFQSHAIFPTYVADADTDEQLLKALGLTIRALDSIDCRKVIIHPGFLPYNKTLTAAQEWDVNIARYSALIPVAKEYGVKICLENMFMGRSGKMYGAICSDMNEACRYIDSLNAIAGEELFGFCLDTGHLLLTGKEVRRSMHEMGKRIIAFHIHDNNGIDDQHISPYMGIFDWDGFIAGLADIGYDSTLSFETFNLWNRFDSEVCPDYMRALARTGRMFAERAEKLRGAKG